MNRFYLKCSVILILLLLLCYYILFCRARELLCAGASVVTGSPCAYDVALWVFAESLAQDVESLPKEIYESRTCCLPFCPFGSPRLNYTGSVRGVLRLLLQSTRMADYELVLRMVMYRRELEHMFDGTARAQRGSAADYAAIGAIAHRPPGALPMAVIEEERRGIDISNARDGTAVAAQPSPQPPEATSTDAKTDASESAREQRKREQEAAGAGPYKEQQRSARSINSEAERRRREEKRR